MTTCLTTPTLFLSNNSDRPTVVNFYQTPVLNKPLTSSLWVREEFPKQIFYQKQSFLLLTSGWRCVELSNVGHVHQSLQISALPKTHLKQYQLLCEYSASTCVWMIVDCNFIPEKYQLWYYSTKGLTWMGDINWFHMEPTCESQQTHVLSGWQHNLRVCPVICLMDRTDDWRGGRRDSKMSAAVGLQLLCANMRRASE